MAGGDVTLLLHAWREGNLDARDRLLGAVYGELRERAAARLRHERRDHLLQPTALVHEAYVRLVDQRRPNWQNRAHFYAIAGEMMRRILIDHARADRRHKRSGRWIRVPIHDAVADTPGPSAELIDLDAALTRLATFDPRKSRIAELRFFGGLSLEETAHVLELSIATIERDWRLTRAWLRAELTGEPSS